MASKSTYWQTLIPLLVYLQLEQHIPIYQAGRQGADGYIYFVPNRHFVREVIPVSAKADIEKSAMLVPPAHAHQWGG